MAKSTAARRRQAKGQARYTSGPKKGQFKKGGRGGKRRRNPPKKKANRRRAAPNPRATTRRASPRARTYRRNPAPQRLMDLTMEAAIDAVQLTVGKAASRSIPGLVKLPQAGNLGAATRLAVGLALGWVVEDWMPDLGLNLTVGAFQGVVEDYAVQFNVPWIGASLARTPGLAGVGRYGDAAALARYARREELGRYARSAPRASLSPRSLGRYARAGY